MKFLRLLGSLTCLYSLDNCLVMEYIGHGHVEVYEKVGIIFCIFGYNLQQLINSSMLCFINNKINKGVLLICFVGTSQEKLKIILMLVWKVDFKKHWHLLF